MSNPDLHHSDTKELDSTQGHPPARRSNPAPANDAGPEFKPDLLAAAIGLGVTVAAAGFAAGWYAAKKGWGKLFSSGQPSHQVAVRQPDRAVANDEPRPDETWVLTSSEGDMMDVEVDPGTCDDDDVLQVEPVFASPFPPSCTVSRSWSEISADTVASGPVQWGSH